MMDSWLIVENRGLRNFSIPYFLLLYGLFGKLEIRLYLRMARLMFGSLYTRFGIRVRHGVLQRLFYLLMRIKWQNCKGRKDRVSLRRGMDVIIASSNQQNRDKTWWLCVVYLPERNNYAISGYMISREKKALCALVDFKEASSRTDACVEAFNESL